MKSRIVVSSSRIEKNPKFLKFVSIRNNYSIIMTILMMIVYFGYILLVAFDKQFLATKVAAGATMSSVVRAKSSIASSVPGAATVA